MEDSKDNIREIVGQAQSLKLESRLKIKRDQEAPIKWLDPEAHEDAIKTSKPLFIEGLSLLGQDPRCQIETPEHQLWTVRGRKFAKGVSNIPEDTEFLIYPPITTQTEEVNGETIEYRNIKYYAIFPRGIILVERNEASLLGKNGLIVGESRPLKGLGIEKMEIGKDEINEILEILRGRINHFPNRG